MQRVRDWMSSNPYTVASAGNLGEAVDLMSRHDIRELPVVDDGKLVGIITDRDIKMALGPDARTMWLEGIDPRLLTGSIDWFMTPDVDTIQSDAPLTEACDRLLDLRVGALPVCTGGELVGILSVTDIVRAARKMLE